MNEIVRKLASIRRIAAIDPIPEADRIVTATVDGWKLVTQKSNNFQVGDLVVYFEIDSFLPVCEKFEFLRESSFKSTKNLGDGFRIKTIKLKGQVSQGLILPMSEFFEFFENSSWDEGQELSEVFYEGADLTEMHGVQKYEKPLPADLAGKVKGNFPSFIPKTDEERIQNIFATMKKMTGLFEVSLKLDGSSMTVYRKDGVIGVCSRNYDLEETEDNLLWKVVRSGDIDVFLEDCFTDNIAFQGELMGPGVHGNREGFKEHRFYVFNMFNIDDQVYMGAGERPAVIEFAQSRGTAIHHVPVIEYITLDQFNTVDDLLAYADRKSINHAIAEGVVFKSLNYPDVSFKVINNKFLLKEKD